jgi:tetratricopeptide (TPR) repeat protein/predicted Ser/Thr protein kinase
MKEAERWSRVSEILAEVLDLPDQERAARLADVCSRQPALRTEVLALFQELRSAEDFLEQPVAAPADLFPATAEGAFGSYRVLETLGEGGMGVVYLAERSDGQFTRQVAVKRIGSVAPGPELLRRFRDERQILARLDHPNIAHLLDAGVDAFGVPYLVMEYVDGVPVSSWCRETQRPLRERLDLYLKVCAAVQNAHQNLVIHRDIKPGNILVTAAGEPKLLDFGIAKMLGNEAAGEVTRTINRALSLDYASPEQVRGEAVTTASDVYSLGVLLYELLADVRPYDAGGKSLTDAVRAVCEQTPAPPSRVAPAERRSRLAGDLDAIVAKAIEKAPADRYASVAELAADVRAHLDDLPVKAQRPSFGYVARKFARRHRTATAVAAGIAILVAAGVAAVVWQSRIAQRERVRAERRFQDVRALANFVIFDLQDGIAKLAGSTELRKTMVERSIGYLDSLAGEAAGDRNLQVELAGAYVRLGDVLGRPAAANLGDRTGAISSYTKARTLLERTLSENGRDTDVRRRRARALLSLHTVYASGKAERELAGKTLDESMQAWEQLLRIEPRAEENLRGLASAHFSAFLHYRKPSTDDAVPHMEQAQALFEQLLHAKPGDSDRKRNVALCHKNLAGHFAGRDQDRSLRHSLRAAQLDSERVASDPHHAGAKLDYALDLSTLGDYYMAERMYDEAFRYYEQSLALRRDLADADRTNVYAASRLAFMLMRIGETQMIRGRYAEARRLLGESLKRLEDLPADRRDQSAAPTLLRAYAALAEAQFLLKQEHCASVRRVAELAPKTLANIEKADARRLLNFRFIDPALARAPSCG